MHMVLKPQDILILLKLASIGSRTLSFAALAESLHMSPSEVHAGLRRAQQAGLYAEIIRKPILANLYEFLIHGVKYAYPPEIGGKTRGMKTSYAAKPLIEYIASIDESLPPVWPTAEGEAFGIGFTPIYPSAPYAASQDSQLYAMLCLVDAIRSGKDREKKIAAELLQKIMG